MFIMVNFKKTGQTDTEFIFIKTVKDTKGFGKTMYRKGRGEKFSKMDLFMKVNSKMGRNGDTDLISGQIILSFRETGLIIILKEMGSTHGLTEESTKASGKIISFMEKVCTHGLTEEDTKDSMNLTKNMDMGLITGLMVNATMASGKMESSMGKLDTLIKKEKVKMEFGKMESV